MASATLNVSDEFPDGTSVSAYLRNQWPVESLTGAPSGAAVGNSPQTVSGGHVTFTGLADGSRYVAYAGSPDRYRRFTTDSLSAASAGGASTVVQATGGTGDQALIAAAIETLRTGGILDGTLEIKGVARLSSALDINLGYTNVAPADAGWATQTPERFTLRGRFKPDAGLGQAITAHGGFGATFDVSFMGGGRNNTATDATVAGGTLSVVNSPASVTAGIAVGCAVQVWGAGSVAGSAAQPHRALVTAVNAGTGAITVDDAFITAVTGAQIVFWDLGLMGYDLVAPRFDIYGKSYAGIPFALDATASSTRRVRSVRPGTISATNCGAGMHIKNVEAFGSLGDIFSDNVWGDWIRADDFAFNKYEGGIGGAGGVNVSDVYLTLDRPNNWNAGKIAVGDRATEAGVKILGVSSGVSGSDIGSIDEVRSTGYQTASMPAALKLCDVTSGHISYILTQNVAKGVHIQGGASNGDEIYIGHHESRTNDDVALYIEPGVNTAPQVTVGECSYRRNNKQAVLVASGLTGGRLKLPGVIVNHNLGNDSTSYAVDCQSAAMLLDVAGLWQQFRSGSTPGGINHADPSMILGMRRARIENPTLHGKVWQGWQGATTNTPPATTDGFRSNHVTIASATNYQNDSPFTLKLRFALRFQPTTTPTTGQIDVFVARQASELGNASQITPYLKPDTGAGAPNDEMREFDVEVPPWHWFKVTLAAATINKVVWATE